MRKSSIALSVAAFLIGGSAAGQAQTAGPANNPTEAARSAPSISPSGAATQNPLVNPSAAGTQTRWRGYGASSGAVSTSQPAAGSAALPSSEPPRSAEQARERLEQLGFSRITRVQHLGGAGWRAVVHRGGRQVVVQLDQAGNLVGERRAAGRGED